MLISGGHVIGINKVKVNKDQFKGDGIWTELSIEPYVDNKINDIKNYINNNFYDKEEVDEIHKNITKDYLRKDEASEIYQPKGDYALSADVEQTINDTKTELQLYVDNNFYNQDYTNEVFLSKIEAGEKYQPVGDYTTNDVLNEKLYDKQDKFTLGSGFDLNKWNENVLETTRPLDVIAGKNIEIEDSDTSIIFHSIRNDLFTKNGNIAADFDEETQQWTLRAPVGNGADWMYLSANGLNKTLDPVTGTIHWDSGVHIFSPNSYVFKTQVIYNNDEEKIIPYLAEIPLKYKDENDNVVLERLLTLDLSQTTQQVQCISDVYTPDRVLWVTPILETDETIPGTFEIKTLISSL